MTIRLRWSASRSIISAVARRSSIPSVHLVVDQAAGGGADRGERRPEVVRDGVEERALEGVALACDVRVAGSGGKAVLLQGLAHLVGDCRQEAGLGRVRAAGGPRARSAQMAPDAAPAGLDRDPVGLASGTLAAPRAEAGPARAGVDGDPLGRLVARPAPQGAVAGRLRGSGAPGSVSAAGRRRRLRLRRGRSRRAAGSASRRRISTIRGSTSSVDGRVASSRLTEKSARASRSRATAVSSRMRSRAAIWPTSRPTARSRTRLSHSPGSATVSVRRGSTNRRSYSRNDGDRRHQDGDAASDERHHGDRQDVHRRRVRDAEAILEQGDQGGRAAERHDANDRRSNQGPGAERLHPRRVLRPMDSAPSAAAADRPRPAPVHSGSPCRMPVRPPRSCPAPRSGSSVAGSSGGCWGSRPGRWATASRSWTRTPTVRPRRSPTASWSPPTTPSRAPSSWPAAAAVVTYELEHVDAALVDAVEAAGVPVRPGCARPADDPGPAGRAALRGVAGTRDRTVARGRRRAGPSRGGRRARHAPPPEGAGRRLRRPEPGPDRGARTTSPARSSGSAARPAPRSSSSASWTSRRSSRSSPPAALDGALAAFPIAAQPPRRRHPRGVGRPGARARRGGAAARARSVPGSPRRSTPSALVTAELFLLRDGTLAVNELAPRVHNSGHWTIEGARTSQFEQHVRAICGLPAGRPGGPRPDRDGQPPRQRASCARRAWRASRRRSPTRSSTSTSTTSGASSSAGRWAT